MAKREYAGGMLARGLGLLVILGEYPHGSSASVVAHKAGLPVSTAYRLLTIMVAQGFVSLDAEQRRYFLGPRLFEVTRKEASIRRLSKCALPSMARVAELTGALTTLSVLEARGAVIVEQVQADARMRILHGVGAQLPLHAAALGKALLAFLPKEEREAIVDELELTPLRPNTIVSPEELRKELRRVRKRGYALGDEENEEGVRSIAVPIMDHKGKLLASISAAVPAFRSSLEDLQTFLPVLLGAAGEIRAQLSSTGPLKPSAVTK